MWNAQPTRIRNKCGLIEETTRAVRSQIGALKIYICRQGEGERSAPAASILCECTCTVRAEALGPIVASTPLTGRFTLELQPLFSDYM